MCATAPRRYGIKSDAYHKYFTQLTGQWDNVYVASEDDKNGSLVATVVATAVMMAPLVLVGVKVGSRLLRQ